MTDQGQPAGDPALKRSFKGHKDQVNRVAFNPNLKQVVSGSQDGTVMVWNFKPTMRPFRFVGHKGPVYDVKVAPSSNVIASCSADKTIRLWNNTVEGHSQVISSPTHAVRSLCFSSNGQLLLSGSDNKQLTITQVADKKFLFSINAAHNNWIRSCQFSPDTRLIASGSDDKTVKLWDFSSRQQISLFQDQDAGINTVKFHPDGTCLASGGQDKTIKIWDIRSQRLIQKYDAHSAQVNEIDFHPNGRYLLSSSNDSTLKIWDLRQGHILYTLYGHEGSSTSAAFSPCGDYFTTGGGDSVVMVWKSNLDENEQEFIEDFGAKTGQDSNVGGVPPVNRKPAKRTTTSRLATANKQVNAGSPQKSQVGGTARQSAGGDFNHDSYVAQPDDPNAVGGSGEELAQTLEKVVSQLGIISRTLHVLEQRVSMNEESVGSVMSYFNEMKNRNSGRGQNINNTNLGYSQTQGHVINAQNLQQSYSQALGSGHLSFNQNIINQQMNAVNATNSMEGSVGKLPSNVGNSERLIQLQENSGRSADFREQALLQLEQNQMTMNQQRDNLEDDDEKQLEVIENTMQVNRQSTDELNERE